MYLFYFILWLIFNGNVTPEIVLFGLVISGAVYAFTCFYMDFSVKKDIALMKKLVYLIEYAFVLIWEVIKANLVMLKITVIKQEYELKPVIFKLNTSLKTKMGRVLLGNAITMTPGTITVSIEKDALIIHAVDESLIVEDDGNFIFERLLLKMEGGADND